MKLTQDATQSNGSGSKDVPNFGNSDNRYDRPVGEKK